ncbi:MAG: polyprenyl synthetase family protein [Actinomycetota bacterium]
MSAFSPSLEELQAAVDAELLAWLDRNREELPEAVPLIDELARLARAGGKRIRPSFCYWGFRSAHGSHGGEIVRAAASLELLHTFAIVHDDIMDAADERRGEPTIHSKHGTSVALLAGDLALVLADALFAGSGFPPEMVLCAFDAYSRMRREVIAGQYLELAYSREPAMSEEDARRIAVLKSGCYSVEEPMLIGASLGGAKDELLAGLARFGRPLGEAFQLRDDLLGTFGEPASTGKPVDSDLREGKRNILFAKAVAALAGEERTFFLSRWGAGAAVSPEEIKRLKALVESSGARVATEGLLSELVDRAGAALADLDVDEEARAALGTLARSATDRSA